MNRKNYLWMCITFLFSTGMMGCSTESDYAISEELSSTGYFAPDSISETLSTNTLYAVIAEEGQALHTITHDDIVITLDDIVAVDTVKGVFKMINTEKIDAVAYPLPKLHYILFYSKGEFLFDAKLNSAISSLALEGLLFYGFFPPNRQGAARYDLTIHRIVMEDGTIVGNPTEQQWQGIHKMYDILDRADKVQSNIEFDFNY